MALGTLILARILNTHQYELVSGLLDPTVEMVPEGRCLGDSPGWAFLRSVSSELGLECEEGSGLGVLITEQGGLILTLCDSILS